VAERMDWMQTTKKSKTQVSISSTYYERSFCQYFGAKNYKAETFGFETFWQKDIGKKFAR